MQSKLTAKTLVLVLVTLSVSALSFGQEQQREEPKEPKVQIEVAPKGKALKEIQKADKYRVRPPSGANFYVGAITELPNNFSVLLTDENNRTVSGSFNARQLQAFETIMIEARNFAETEESVGVTKPITTRFYDKIEPVFIVDVAKLQEMSQFFVTLRTAMGDLTVDAGTITRGEKKEQGFYFVIYQRIVAAKAITWPVK
jgi:hypothetical protein